MPNTLTLLPLPNGSLEATVQQSIEALSNLRLNLFVNQPQTDSPASFKNSAELGKKILELKQKCKVLAINARLKLAILRAKYVAKSLTNLAKRLITATTNHYRTSGLRERSSSAKSGSVNSNGSSDPDRDRPSNYFFSTSSLSYCLPPLILRSAFLHLSYKSVCYIIQNVTNSSTTKSINEVQINTGAQPRPLNDRILRLKEVVIKTGLSRSMIYLKINNKSPYFDPDFPKKKMIGLRSIGFLESDINNWIANLNESLMQGGNLK